MVFGHINLSGFTYNCKVLRLLSTSWGRLFNGVVRDDVVGTACCAPAVEKTMVEVEEAGKAAICEEMICCCGCCCCCRGRRVGGNFETVDPWVDGVVAILITLCKEFCEVAGGKTDNCRGLVVSTLSSLPPLPTPPPTTEAPAAAAM